MEVSPLCLYSLSSRWGYSRIVFSLIAAGVLAFAPKPACAQHGGRGFHGGGGAKGSRSQRSVLHGGGRGNSGRGGGRFPGGRGGSSRGGLPGWMSATPRHREGGSYQRSGGFAPGPGGWNGLRSVPGARRGSTMMPGSGAFFGSSEAIRNVGHAGEPRSAALNLSNGSSVWHSFGNPGSRAVPPGPRSSGAATGEWHSFGPRVNGARPEMARSFGNASGRWQSFGNVRSASVVGAMAANRQARSADFGSSQRTITGSASASWSRRTSSIPATAPRSAPSSTVTRGLWDLRDSGFGGSALGFNTGGRFSRSRLGDSNFEGRHPFHSDTTNFGQEGSFGEGGFLFAADLLSSVLDFGGFGLRGLALLGAGLGQFGLDVFPQFGFGWLFGQGFGSDAAARSAYGTPYQSEPSWSCGRMGPSDLAYDSRLPGPPCSTEYPGSSY
jgi:hypothetical protein